MKFGKYIAGIFLFFLLGELILRVDEKIAPFSEDEHIFLPRKLAETAELNMAKTHTVPLDDSTFRIVVLGDSYINGWGTDANRKFSNVLRANLTNGVKSKYKRFLVLDISSPGNNSLDNYRVHHQYYDSFKPQVVILPYNINDVEDNLDENVKADSLQVQINQHINKPTITHQIYLALYHIHLVEFLLHNFHSYLKSLGIVIPKSDLDIQLKAYTQNQPSWVKSKVILNKFMKETSSKNEKMIVVLMPEYNLLKHLDAFIPTYNIVDQFFSGRPNVIFINPVNYFRNYPVQELRVSKYDGHPSITAHKILADSVAAYITRNYLIH